MCWQRRLRLSMEKEQESKGGQITLAARYIGLANARKAREEGWDEDDQAIEPKGTGK